MNNVTPPSGTRSFDDSFPTNSTPQLPSTLYEITNQKWPTLVPEQITDEFVNEAAEFLKTITTAHYLRGLIKYYKNPNSSLEQFTLVSYNAPQKRTYRGVNFEDFIPCHKQFNEMDTRTFRIPPVIEYNKDLPAPTKEDWLHWIEQQKTDTCLYTLTIGSAAISKTHKVFFLSNPFGLVECFIDKPKVLVNIKENPLVKNSLKTQYIREFGLGTLIAPENIRKIPIVPINTTSDVVIKPIVRIKKRNTSVIRNFSSESNVRQDVSKIKPVVSIMNNNRDGFDRSLNVSGITSNISPAINIEDVQATKKQNRQQTASTQPSDLKTVETDNPLNEYDGEYYDLYGYQ